ncbi:EamA family transporter [Rhodobacterales bacterium 52_120_T64]|nr:EamA family transporter [Rhodobacterales bacterium 52_120_T64]
MRGHGAMLLFSVLVAGSFSLGSIAAPMIEPSALNAIRFLIAGAIIAPLVFLGPGLKREHLVAPWRYLLLGGLFAIYFVLMFEGLKFAPAISTSAVFTLTPVMSAGFGWLLLRQITTPRMTVALTLAAMGAVWVIFRGNIDAILAFNIGKGETIFFFGCVAHAIYTPLVRKLNRGEPTLVFTLGTLLAGFFVLSIYGAKDIVTTDWAALPAIVWITILYVAIFASSATFFLLQYASLNLPSAKVMAYTYLVPAWVILWEALMGNGFVEITVLAGVALTIVALLMLLKD